MEAVLAILGVLICVGIFFIRRVRQEARQEKARAERERQRAEDREWARGIEARRVAAINETFASEPTPVAVREPEPASEAEPAPEPVPDAASEVICGKAWVVDGDTIDVAKVRLRLFGIDAPEMEHPFGKKAKWAMQRLCKGQEVRAEIVGHDAHGRTVARCFLPDGRDLSAELVRQGLALDWPKFSDGAYAALEHPGVRKKLWLAAARQKGHMHVWERYAAQQAQKD